MLRGAGGVVERYVRHPPLTPEQVHALPVDMVRLERLLPLEHVQPPVFGGLARVRGLAVLEVDAVDLVRRVGELAGGLIVGLELWRVRRLRVVVLQCAQLLPAAERELRQVLLFATLPPRAAAATATTTVAKVLPSRLVDLLHGQADLAPASLGSIDRDYFDLHGVADVDDILHGFHPPWGQLRYMHEAVRHEAVNLCKSPKGLDGENPRLMYRVDRRCLRTTRRTATLSAR
mmetsp:Transcript_6921/g.13814  ORF Transcript_6921/g.13814 Transcript_6921/m.13814 type:complete len:232 (-) Transcript_6921:69-764(-)